MKEAANRGGPANLKDHSFDPQDRWARKGQDAEWCVLVTLGDWLVLNCPTCPLYRPHDPDQQDRPDKPGYQVADPSP